MQRISHIKSFELNPDGTAKLPSVEDILNGELAINYAKGVETISFKNNHNEIVTVSTTEQINEKINNLKKHIENNIPNEVFIGEEIIGEPDIFIDTTDNNSVEVYTKEQVDLLINDLNKKIEQILSIIS